MRPLVFSQVPRSQEWCGVAKYTIAPVALSSGDLQRAANHSRPRALVVYSPDDHVVTSAAAESYARLIGAEILSIPSPCGHAVLLCEAPKVGSAIHAFLTK